MDKAGDLGPSAANNSSDFVRKLYKMLEDPSYDKIVKWGETGDSFVVLENDKFTKQILPKHFKHSNFASFVRQLNKYDFHKVRQNNEESAPSIYAAGAWEFRHPEFQMNKKDNLDNIRRKAPAPRKLAQAVDDAAPGQQMEYLSTQLAATQQQLQHLNNRYNDLAQGHVILLEQVLQMQKFVKSRDGVMHRVMGYLHTVDDQRRNSRIEPFTGTGMNDEPLSNEGLIEEQPATFLVEADDLLHKYPITELPNKALEHMADDFQRLRDDYSTPPSNDQDNSAMDSQSRPQHHHTQYTSGDIVDSGVYPVGHTNGIDPINSDHIHNIPYPLPAEDMMTVNSMPEMLPEGSPNLPRKKNAMDSAWGVRKPRILLVEDDKICARIGSKFLQGFECGVDIARDGLEAVNKINHGINQFDLILMDIIMPRLDGVSATVCIREINPKLPIIAMTSNIRTDDIDMYFRYGMNDVLPKPFTKEGMLRALEKHLPAFRKDAQFPPSPGSMANPNGINSYPASGQSSIGMNMAPMSAAPSLKEESPGNSPATVTSWESKMPGQMPGQISSQMPNQMSGPIPGQMAGQIPSQMSGQRPGHVPSQMNAPMPGQMMSHGPMSSPAPIHTSVPYMQQQPMGDGRQYAMPPTMTPTHSYPQSGFAPPHQGMMTPRPSHRRGLSDMSGGPQEDHQDKRQRMYPPSQGSFTG